MEWINVKNKLPICNKKAFESDDEIHMESERVFVVLLGQITYGTYDEEFNWWWIDADHFHNVTQVTHWMPFPELQNMEWINVNDKLPICNIKPFDEFLMESEKVLVVVNGNITFGRLDEDNDWSICKDYPLDVYFDYTTVDEKVTHWMPLCTPDNLLGEWIY
jgi:hypothetical protein